MFRNYLKVAVRNLLGRHSSCSFTQQIAREVNARYVLEGSVRKAKDSPPFPFSWPGGNGS